MSALLVQLSCPSSGLDRVLRSASRIQCWDLKYLNTWDIMTEVDFMTKISLCEKGPRASVIDVPKKTVEKGQMCEKRGSLSIFASTSHC